MEVDFFVFHAAPEPLDEDVVHPSPFAIHTDFHAFVFESLDPILRGELHTLIGVEDLGLTAGCGEGFLQSIQAEAAFHGVGKRPAQDLAGMPVHDGAQVGKAPRHGDIGDVSAPNLIRPIDGEISQEVGIFAMRFVREGRFGFAIDRFDPHLATKSLEFFTVDHQAVISPQKLLETPRSHARVDQIILINEAFEAKVFRAGSNGLIAHGGAGHSEQVTLSSHAD